jgi:hypothetical protein
MNKGQSILAVIMWATGISVTVGTVAFGITNARFEKMNDTIQVSATATAILQTESREYRENIKEIKDAQKEMNAKLDTLIKGLK